MKGDFTRDTFNPAKHFSRVLMQQGRVMLDADFNEQRAIDLHYLRTLARDIIGPYAAPANTGSNFMLLPQGLDVFSISKGHYYVDGILVENEEECSYRKQPDYVPPEPDPLLQAIQQNDTNTHFMIYLDVWERHITSIEDDSTCEKALGGRDTCARAKVVWQVKALKLTGTDLPVKQFGAQQQVDLAKKMELQAKAGLEKQLQQALAQNAPIDQIVEILTQLQGQDDIVAQAFRLSRLQVHEALLSELVGLSNASLAARVNPVQQTEDPCVTPPDSKYRGAENQLYRVEIHRRGAPPLDAVKNAATTTLAAAESVSIAMSGAADVSGAKQAADTASANIQKDANETAEEKAAAKAVADAVDAAATKAGATLDAVNNAATTTVAAAQPVFIAVFRAADVSGAKQAADTASANIQKDANKTAEEKAAAKAVADAVDAAAAAAGSAPPPTFKWSRDNGSVATAWLSLQGNDLKVASTRGFATGNWVELSDDTSDWMGQPGTLVQLIKVDGDTLSVDPATTLPLFTNFPRNPKIRRWDYIATEAIPLANDNSIPVQESPAGATPDKIVWIDLEDGVQIQFSANGEYRTGDYWLIPARVATGNFEGGIEWPLDGSSNPQPLPLPPDGIEHHYALLGLGTALNIHNDRFEFWPICFSSSQ